jgi:hypothetical protein
MSAARYQITTFNKNSSQFSRVADQSIHAGIKAEDLPRLLGVEADSLDMRVALERTAEGKKYSFKNSRDEFSQLELATS